MEYTKLEQKIIEKGFQSFKNELREASKPMLSVLKKYGITNDHVLLKKITLFYPRRDDCNCDFAVNIPCDEELASIEGKILDNFLEEVNKFKERINDLEDFEL